MATAHGASNLRAPVQRNDAAAAHRSSWGAFASAAPPFIENRNQVYFRLGIGIYIATANAITVVTAVRIAIAIAIGIAIAPDCLDALENAGRGIRLRLGSRLRLRKRYRYRSCINTFGKFSDSGQGSRQRSDQHSLSATIGSTLLALRAGRYAARSATAASNATATA